MLRVPCLHLFMVVLLIAAPGIRGLAQDEQEVDAPDVLYQQGLALFLKGDYAGAITKFEPIIELFSDEPELRQALEQVYYALGSSYYNQQRYEEAVATFKEYVKRYPEAGFVDEGLFRIGVALQSNEAYGDAVTEYGRLLTEKPASVYAEDAAFQIGVCYLEQNDFEQVAKAFETFTKAYPRSALYSQAMMFLARAHFETSRLEEALQTIGLLDTVRRSLDHIVYVNFLAIEIGDVAFDETDYDTALRAYRRVRTRESLLRLQRGYVKSIEAAAEALDKRKVNARTITSKFREQRRLYMALARARAIQDQLKKMPTYDAGLFYRIGSCFSNSDRFWEARVAFQRVVDEAKDKTVKEAAHFDLAMTLSRLRRFDDLVQTADAYLHEFGKDEKLLKNGRVASIAFMRAESYINQERFEEAEVEMVKLQKDFPDFVRKERVEFYIALSKSMLEKFHEGIPLFESWLSNYPDHMLKGEVAYWLPIALFYDSQYARALPMFREYEANYPMMPYAPEAGYRAALCLYSLERFEECAASLKGWTRANPDHYFSWEALLTRADALAASGHLEEAKVAYQRVTKDAGPFYFLALNQAAKVYEALGTEQDMVDMARLFLQYVNDNPDSPNIVDAAHKAGTALRHVGKEQQARDYYWRTIERYGNNRKWEGFALLLDDLRHLYGDDHELMTADFALAKRRADKEDRRTLSSRLELARIAHAPADTVLNEARDFALSYEAEILGADGLAFLGEVFVGAGRADKGMTYLERLLAEYPGSRHTGVAHVKKGVAFLEAKEYDRARESAEAALVVARDPALFMEAVFLRARARQALEDYAAAMEDYNLVIANRASPRQLKPAAMLGLAGCHEASGAYSKAIPYYQRIYVLYGAYEDAVAEAYLKSGLAFEHLKDWQAAANTYREMLADDRLSGTKEAQRARARLEKLQS